MRHKKNKKFNIKTKKTIKKKISELIAKGKIKTTKKTSKLIKKKITKIINKINIKKKKEIKTNYIKTIKIGRRDSDLCEIVILKMLKN